MDTFNRRAVAALVFALVAAGTMACSQSDPCAALPAPSPADLALSNQGREIEQVVEAPGLLGGTVEVECDLENGRWVADVES